MKQKTSGGRDLSPLGVASPLRPAHAANQRGEGDRPLGASPLLAQQGEQLLPQRRVQSRLEQRGAQKEDRGGRGPPAEAGGGGGDHRDAHPCEPRLEHAVHRGVAPRASTLPEGHLAVEAAQRDDAPLLRCLPPSAKPFAATEQAAAEEGRAAAAPLGRRQLATRVRAGLCVGCASLCVDNRFAGGHSSLCVAGEAGGGCGARGGGLQLRRVLRAVVELAQVVNRATLAVVEQLRDDGAQGDGPQRALAVPVKHARHGRALVLVRQHVEEGVGRLPVRVRDVARHLQLPQLRRKLHLVRRPLGRVRLEQHQQRLVPLDGAKQLAAAVDRREVARSQDHEHEV
mmetsp:Transcript_37511/g.118037  ORF Transcript_37511/g.118037 Transcript_37511/m.118037 type:complete len:342 (+) Transcript_37511:439-1464(+)